MAQSRLSRAASASRAAHALALRISGAIIGERTQFKTASRSPFD